MSFFLIFVYCFLVCVRILSIYSFFVDIGVFCMFPTPQTITETLFGRTSLDNINYVVRAGKLLENTQRP